MNASIYFKCGLVEYKLKVYTGAISDFTKTIEIAPNHYKAFFFRANAKAKISDFKGAIADYTRTIEFQPDFNRAYYNRGLAKYILKDEEGAFADYCKAIVIDPSETLPSYTHITNSLLPKDFLD